MKKPICVLLAAMMCLTLCACGNESTPAGNKSDGQSRVAAFIEYLKVSCSENSITEGDTTISASVDEENAIQIHFTDCGGLPSSNLNVTIDISIPTEKGDAIISAEGEAATGSMNVLHLADGIWHIADYNKSQNAITWEKSSWEGGGEGLSPLTGSGSIFTDDNEQLTSSYLDLITTYLECILEESETGATMADIGFLSY